MRREVECWQVVSCGFANPAGVYILIKLSKIKYPCRNFKPTTQCVSDYTICCRRKSAKNSPMINKETHSFTVTSFLTKYVDVALIEEKICTMSSDASLKESSNTHCDSPCQ